MKRLFILGCERSGSTWLANVLDAHPAVLLFMEPFAGYARLFPEVPGRNSYLPDVADDLVEHVGRNWADLSRSKFPLFTAPRYPHPLRVLGRRVIQAYSLLRSPTWIRRYTLLNLNHQETAARRWPRKAPQPVLEVTKELRLNFKIALLAKTFAEAKIMVSIRHPSAQLESVERMFDRGHLAELKNSLQSLPSTLEKEERLAKYSVLKPRTSTELLASWWLINYEVLLEDIDHWGLPHRVVSNEELSESPAATAGSMLRFAGLAEDPAVDSYLQWSTTTTGSGGALDTRRQSREYSRKAIARAAPSIRPALMSMVDRLPSLHPVLEAYF